MEIRVHPAAEVEFDALDEREREAMKNALLKLRSLGPQLSFPHVSSVRGQRGLWELRPRAGRSRWRAIYSLDGERVYIFAVVPEAMIDRKGFRRGIQRAVRRRMEVLGA